MTISKKQLFYIKLIFILFLIFIPWSVADYSDNVTTRILVQEDLTYYEINPCKLSLTEFLVTENKSIYQDHFHFRFNNSSSIGCFGKISGVTLFQDEFYISIGTNPFLNIIFVSFLWITVISFIPKDKSRLYLKSFEKSLSIFLTIYLFTFSIYSEQRFYNINNYQLDFERRLTYIYFFVLLSLIIYNFISILLPRFNSLILLIPFLYIFIGNISGFNFSLFSSYIIFFGFYSLLTKNINLFFNKLLFGFSMVWILNTSNRYYFSPDKIRGFTSSIYEFNSTIFWTLFFILFLNGLAFIFKEGVKNFAYSKFLINLQNTSIFILILGIIGANFPIVNFLNYFYFGQQRYGISQNNPFAIDEFSEKISWRGFYSSAETIGEFYGIVLLLTLYQIFKNKKISKLNLFSISFSLFGLYFSNNRTVMGLLVLFILYLFLSTYLQIPKRYLFFLVLVSFIIIVLFFAQSNLGYSYEFMSNNVFIFAKEYQYDTIQSSFSRLLETSFSNSNLFSKFFGLFSILGFLLNRSEVWGIFFARYNPTFTELIFGTGPFNYGQLYGEIIVNNTRSFLLPHSSLLSFLLFFGLFGITLIFMFIFNRYRKVFHKISALSQFLIFYIFVNFIKNDFINYFSTFLFYSFILFIIFSSFRPEPFKNNSIKNRK